VRVQKHNLCPISGRPRGNVQRPEHAKGLVMKQTGRVLLILLVGTLLVGGGRRSLQDKGLGVLPVTAMSEASPVAPQEAQDQNPVLLAAGDIANCVSAGAEATARLLRSREGTIAALGDLAYRRGSPQQFAECYDPTWGTEKARTRPAVGNHEYGTRNAAGYFAYFQTAAGPAAAGYYSYDFGSWHIIVLNSNCEEIGGCEAASPQGEWLRADLATHNALCTLAYWHHPLFSSGTTHGGDEAMRPAWRLLYEAGADVVLSGHEHNYERFAPQDPDGTADPQHGIRAFVVGTGGASHYPFGEPLPLSERRNAETYGVLALSLQTQGYDWEFIPITSPPDLPAAQPFTDSGSGACH
jgi:hypothetical protein